MCLNILAACVCVYVCMCWSESHGNSPTSAPLVWITDVNHLSQLGSLLLHWEVKLFIILYFACGWFACMYVCLPLVCQVPRSSEKNIQYPVPWNWSCGCLCTTICVLNKTCSLCKSSRFSSLIVYQLFSQLQVSGCKGKSFASI